MEPPFAKKKINNLQDNLQDKEKTQCSSLQMRKWDRELKCFQIIY